LSHRLRLHLNTAGPLAADSRGSCSLPMGSAGRGGIRSCRLDRTRESELLVIVNEFSTHFRDLFEQPAMLCFDQTASLARVAFCRGVF
jgi:hypothetical protein